MKSILKKILNRSDEYTDLITRANAFPRYTDHQFNFGKYNLHVSDFISVAWQIKEIFGEEELKFKSDKSDPLIIDCGANVGISVLYFRKLFPNARIIAFEPDPKLAGCLRENLASNKIFGVDLKEKAVWINNDGISFGSDGADGGSVFLESNKHKVASERLKDLLSNEPVVDFLKMDIEGAEVEVLSDCANELSGIKNIFVEYHSWKHLPQQLDKLLKLLTDCGFRYYIRSLGRHVNPFVEEIEGAMDIQLNINAVKI